jgi:hypothetical protein
MSRQTNLYADRNDTLELHDWLERVFPGLTVIPTDRGSARDLKPIPPEEAWLRPGDMMFLVPQWAADKVVLRPLRVKSQSKHNGDLYCVGILESPIIEYSPCIVDEATNSIVRGRLYWSGGGEVSPEENRQVDRMFRWVRTHTVSAGWGHRVFEEAARNHRMLVYDSFDMSKREPSPPWTK